MAKCKTYGVRIVLRKMGKNGNAKGTKRGERKGKKKDKQKVVF